LAHEANTLAAFLSIGILVWLAFARLGNMSLDHWLVLSVDMVYFGEGIVLRSVGMSGYDGAVMPFPEKGERLCANP
jgi:hypothetical protein